MATRHAKGKGGKWTVRELQALDARAIGDTLGDGEGLFGEVRSAADGAVSVRWRYAFRWQGKTEWHQCGTWPSTSLDDVRRERDKARALVEQGTNPRDAKKAGRIEAQQRVEAVIAAEELRRVEDLTVRDLVRAWLADGVNRKDGNAELRRQFEADVLPLIGDRAVRLTSADDIRGVVRAIVARGALRVAVQVFTAVRSMFTWAEKRQPWRRLLIEGNPTDLVELDKLLPSGYDFQNVRKRRLSDDEVRELHAILVEMDRGHASAEDRRKARRPLHLRTRVALWLCLSTTCRIGELLMSEWRHVDLAKREWFIPAENSKRSKGEARDHLVFLSDFAVRQFEALRRLSGGHAYCFPAARAGGKDQPGHVSLLNVTQQVRDRQMMFRDEPPSPVEMKNRKLDNSLVLAGGAHGSWTPHDMRRTSATLMQRLGIHEAVIDRCQNHVLAGSGTRRHYLLHEFAAEKREAWRRVGEHLDALVTHPALRLVAA